MNIRINGTLSGEVTPPPSKSQAHRMLICAALGNRPCTIACSTLNDDLIATTNCLNTLGAHITYDNGLFKIEPIKIKKNGTLDCGESGSTLRFLLPVAAILEADATFVGHGKLPQRPNGALCEALESHGITFERHNPEAELPLTCHGRLRGGKYTLPGNISSQYLTGLLFALPLAQEDSEIEITGLLTSASYIEMTLDAISMAGIKITRQANTFYIKGGQQYSLPQKTRIEGDWSSAAFWIVAGVIGEKSVTVCNMHRASLQGDRHIIEHLRKMGAFIEETERGIVANPSQLFGTEIDCTDTPDLVPILSVAASAALGTTVFTNVGRLRYKESDRLAAMKSMLTAFGIVSEIGTDTFAVHGNKSIAMHPIESFGDHRIAMSAAILSTISQGTTEIKDSGCVAKSYPRFFEDFVSLGGFAQK